MQLIFDTICVDKADQTRECFEPAAFARIPLSERIKCILEKRVHFFQAGQELDSRIALKNYREWAAKVA